MTSALLGRVVGLARMHSPVRRLCGRRSVFRQVQGVGLWMPWAHRLPDYAAIAPTYGQNLVDVATHLAQGADSPLQVVDVGANIGDSALQILARVDARVLAVEPDPFYLGFLRRNVADRPDVTVAPYLLNTASDAGGEWVAARKGGTAHFTRRDSPAAVKGELSAQQTLPVADIRSNYPAFDQVRLVKSDTDGYDTRLIPELADAFASSRPVLFFEFDPALTARVAGVRADDVWPDLAARGYDRVGLWDNAGVPLGVVAIARAAEFTRDVFAEHGVPYLDAVAVHADDLAGQSTLSAIFGA